MKSALKKYVIQCITVIVRFLLQMVILVYALQAMSQYAAYMQQAQGGSQQQGMNSTVRWAAKKRFAISNFKFKFPRA